VSEYKAWFDGSCGPCNPGGTAASGAIVRDEKGTVLLEEHRLVGTGAAMTNNVGEYRAIIHVFEHLASRPAGHVTVHGDSRLVINQLNGHWRIGEGLYRSAALEAQGQLERLRGPRLASRVAVDSTHAEQRVRCAIQASICRGRSTVGASAVGHSH
jgi:ribonuclease HI